MVSSHTPWPDWWDWELDCANPHLAKRMLDRGFSETDLRAMLEQATGFRADHDPGRWVIDSSHHNRRWQIIVEPDLVERLLIVVTAYPVDD